MNQRNQQARDDVISSTLLPCYACVVDMDVGDTLTDIIRTFSAGTQS